MSFRHSSSPTIPITLRLIQRPTPATSPNGHHSSSAQTRLGTLLGDPSIVIAIVDTGIDPTTRTWQGKSFWLKIRPRGRRFPIRFGHGTHVAASQRQNQQRHGNRRNLWPLAASFRQATGLQWLWADLRLLLPALFTPQITARALSTSSLGSSSAHRPSYRCP